MFLGSFNRSFLIYLFLLIPGAHDWLFYFAPHSTTTSSPVKITLPRCAEACFLADVKDGGGAMWGQGGAKRRRKIVEENWWSFSRLQTGPCPCLFSTWMFIKVQLFLLLRDLAVLSGIPRHSKHTAPHTSNSRHVVLFKMGVGVRRVCSCETKLQKNAH